MTSSVLWRRLNKREIKMNQRTEQSGMDIKKTNTLTFTVTELCITYIQMKCYGFLPSKQQIK